MDRNRRCRVLMLVLLPVLALTGGCNILKNPVVSFTDDGEVLHNPAGDGLVLSPTPFIPDVPVPVGFKAVASKSSSSFNGQIRTVNHYYQGRAILGQTLEFYEAHLPRNDWRFDGQSVSGQWTTLRYTKGAERLTVSIRHFQGVASVDVRIASN